MIGVTGAPGAGKSTLAAALVARRRQAGERVAVLAVDPSSPVSGGAMLGDRVRMQAHATDAGVFVRSMASRGVRGGLAAAAPAAVRVLDAAGWPEIVVEAVGGGQSDTDVAMVATTTVAVVNPGWGDSVQAEKAGVLEVADVLVVNKADRPGAAEARAVLTGMLDLVVTGDGWRPPVVATSALGGDGVDDLVVAIADHRAWLDGEDRRAARRRSRMAAELRWTVGLRAGSAGGASLRGPAFDSAVDALVAGSADPLGAADDLLGGPSSGAQPGLPGP